MTAYVVDTETTGFSEPRQVIELAWAGFPTGVGGRMRFKPSRTIEWGAMATHHILPEELNGFGPAAEAARHLPPMHYMIGHNVDFDWEVLGKPAVKRICTLALARLVWPKLDSHSLGALMYALKGASDATRTQLRNAHSASEDVLMDVWLMDQICQATRTAQDDFERMWALSEDARVPRIMTFGKHKGKEIADVDRGYVAWYRKQPDTDPYLIEAFRRAGLCS